MKRDIARSALAKAVRAAPVKAKKAIPVKAAPATAAKTAPAKAFKAAPAEPKKAAPAETRDMSPELLAAFRQLGIDPPGMDLARGGVRFRYDSVRSADLPATTSTYWSEDPWAVDWSYDESDDPDGESRWLPTVEGEPVRLFSRKEAAEYVAVPERWIVESIIEPFPDPDGMVGSRAGWLESTLRQRQDVPKRGYRRVPVHFLSRTEVSKYMGVKGHSGLMPPPDAVLGSRFGWRPATIDYWVTLWANRGRSRSVQGISTAQQNNT